MAHLTFRDHFLLRDSTAGSWARTFVQGRKEALSGLQSVFGGLENYPG